MGIGKKIKNLVGPDKWRELGFCSRSHSQKMIKMVDTETSEKERI